MPVSRPLELESVDDLKAANFWTAGDGIINTGGPL
jgi:hypothetical protein